PFLFLGRKVEFKPKGGLILWLEPKLAAKLLPQPTRQSTALTFTQRSVPVAVSSVALAAFSRTASWLVPPARRAVVFPAAQRRRPNTLCRHSNRRTGCF